MILHSTKKFAFAASLALLLPIAAAPSANAARPAQHAKSPVNLIWFMRTDPNETAWERSVTSIWNKAHADIQVKLITAPNPNGQFDLKFNQLIQSGTPADIWSHLGQAGFGDYYHRGLLLNVSPILKQLNYNWGGTPKNLINTYAKSDGIYAIPSITLGSYLFYNKDIFDAYNKAHPMDKIAYPTINWGDKTNTFAKVVAEAKKLTGLSIKTSSGTTTSYGFLDQQWPSMYAAFQMGTDMFPKGSYETGLPKTVNLTDPRIVSVYQTLADYFNVQKISPPYSKVKQINNTGADPFQFGNIAMVLNGGWNFRNLLTAKFHWGAAALPYRVTNHDMLFTDPYMVSKASKNPKEAVEFIQYLTSKDAMTSYIHNVGFTPANADALPTWYSQYSKITGQSVADLTTLVNGARKYGTESPNHLIVNFSQIQNSLQTYLDKIYYGQGSAASVLKDAQGAIDAILAQSAGQ